MDVEVLINQLEEHNEGSVLATKKFNPEEVIFLYEEKNQSILEAIKKYYEDNFPKVKFNEVKAKEGEVERLEEIIRNNENRNILVNLTGGSKVNSLILSNICANKGVRSIYMNIKEKILYIIDKNIRVMKEEYEDLELSSLLSASGKEIVYDSGELFSNKNLKYITKKIYTNLELWHKYKQRLYDVNVFIHNEEDSNKMIIKTKLLNKDEKYFR